MAVDLDASSEISNVEFDKDCNGIVHITNNDSNNSNNNGEGGGDGDGDGVGDGDACYVFVEQIQQSQTHNTNGADNSFYEVVEEEDPQSLTNPNEPLHDDGSSNGDGDGDAEEDDTHDVHLHDAPLLSNGEEECAHNVRSNEVQFGGEDNKIEEQSEVDSSVVNAGVDPDSENLISDNAAFSVDAMDDFSVNGVHLEPEPMDRDDRDETNISASDIEVTHNLEDVHEDAATSEATQTESEYKILNESFENNTISAHPVAAVKQIIMFGNISAEYGNAFHTPAKFSALEPVVRDLSVEKVETISGDEGSPLSEVSAPNSENASESVDSSIDVQDEGYQLVSGSSDVEEVLEEMEVVGGCKNQPSTLENSSKSVDNSLDVQYEGDQSVSADSGAKEILEDIGGDKIQSSPTESTSIHQPEGQKVEQEVLEEMEVVGDCKIQPSPTENASKSAHNSLDVQYEGDQSVGGESGAKEILEEIEGVKGNKSHPSPTESTSIHQLEGQKVEQEVVRGPFYLIRIPYLGDKFTNEINLAKLQVDEKTKSREAIRLAIRSKKDTCGDCLAKFEAAKSEERAAKDAFNAKRDKMDSIQTEINRMKNATSIDDIDERILKQQLNVARKEMLQAEGVTREAKKIYFDEENKLQELKGQFRAADDVRQEAYSHFQNLKKQLYDKNKYFWKYKDNQRKARDLRGDTLQQLCVSQVESIMDLWNKNDEFRNEYVRCNVNSTLWRLGTLDGCRLGPDEKPPVVHTAVRGKVDNAVVVSEDTNSTSLGTLGAQVGNVNSAVNLEHKNPKENTKSVLNLEQSASTKSEKAAKPISSNITSASGSGREGTDEKAEVNKRTLEDEELTRKEEELRKEESAAKLKELQRSEEMAKAKEANERKKRNALKALARAELRAQKEAALKEKEREKRARKKERKRAAGVELANGEAEGEPASSAEIDQPEITTENKVEEKTSASVAKRHQKPSILVKQTRPMPAPLLVTFTNLARAALASDGAYNRAIVSEQSFGLFQRCLTQENLDEHFVIFMDGVNVFAVNYGSPETYHYPQLLKLDVDETFPLVVRTLASGAAASLGFVNS
ncbi:hypothetical protein Sjap_009321 [Stephania japonica]|uniref:Uncharacterized protein n=1 Tax=Stephania japonica TaxID=461633 RepID=A0AAP0PC62_9MAGN